MSSTTCTIPKNRLEAFSDGVLAIAITLLILEIKVPESEHGRLWHDLGHLWPSYAAYALSFLTIGIMWVNHHYLFELVDRVDHTLIYANLGLLASISFLPFPTSVVADYLREGGSNGEAAVALYGLTMIAVSVTFGMLWNHLRRKPQLVTNSDRDASAIVAGVRNSFVSAGVYIATGLLAFVSPYGALAAYGAIAVLFTFSRPPGEPLTDEA